MRTRYKSILSLFMLVFLCSIGTSAQTDPDEILNNIENTENYETIELVKMDPNFSIFVDLVEKSGLDVSMKIADDHTLFVPTNEAFGDMDVERLTKLRNPQNRAELVKFINYHVLPTEVRYYEFDNANMIETQDNDVITVESGTAGNIVNIGGAEVVKSDIQAANGIIHIVNRWIEPNEDILGQ